MNCLHSKIFLEISHFFNQHDNCERLEPRSHFKRLSLIVRVNVGLLLLTVTDVSTTYAVVIFRVKVSCITSDDDNVVA